MNDDERKTPAVLYEVRKKKMKASAINRKKMFSTIITEEIRNSNSYKNDKSKVSGVKSSLKYDIIYTLSGRRRMEVLLDA